MVSCGVGNAWAAVGSLENRMGQIGKEHKLAGEAQRCQCECFLAYSEITWLETINLL